MEYKGKLIRWNDEKGFGFITPENGSKKEIFLHISTLKNTSRRPIENDIIFYQLYTESSGKTKAINARIEGVSFIKPTIKSRRKETPKPKNSFTNKLIFILFLGTAIGFIVQKFNVEKVVPKIENNRVSESEQNLNVQIKQSYRCDGRQHCSQMSSCEEAIFFIKNCPDTKMDGDNDGVPCEDMCGH